VPSLIFLPQAGKPYGVDFIERNSKSTWTPRIFSGRNSAVPPNSRIPSPSPSLSQKIPNVNENGVPPRDQRRTNVNEAGVSLKDNRRTRLLQSQHTVRVHYNAKVIGARDVLHYYEQYTQKEIRLAPPAPHPGVGVGSLQTKRAGVIFTLSAVFTIPVVFFAWGPVNHQNLLYAHLSLAFASVVQGIAVWEFFPGEPISTLCYVEMVY
jgi:hypothetical protein